MFSLLLLCFCHSSATALVLATANVCATPLLLLSFCYSSATAIFPHLLCSFPLSVLYGCCHYAAASCTPALHLPLFFAIAIYLPRPLGGIMNVWCGLSQCCLSVHISKQMQGFWSPLLMLLMLACDLCSCCPLCGRCCCCCLLVLLLFMLVLRQVLLFLMLCLMLQLLMLLMPVSGLGLLFPLLTILLVLPQLMLLVLLQYPCCGY